MIRLLALGLLCAAFAGCAATSETQTAGAEAPPRDGVQSLGSNICRSVGRKQSSPLERLDAEEVLRGTAETSTRGAN